MTNTPQPQSYRAIYKRQGEKDRANRGPLSKIAGLLFPLLLVIGWSLHGHASNVYEIVLGSAAVAFFVLFAIMVTKDRRSRCHALHGSDSLRTDKPI